MKQQMTSEEYIEHYGVKGMKWGVRKARNEVERAKTFSKNRDSRIELKKNRRNLSDKEIERTIQRLNNEKKLKELIEDDVAPGKKVAKKVLSESGQKVARTVIAGAALYVVKTVVEKKFGPEAAKYVAPKPKSK